MNATQVAIPAIAPNHAIALARAAPSVLAWIVESTWGATRAAPSPWATRAATSRPADGASAHHTEAAPNHTSPIRSTRRRPRLSPSRPPSTTVLA